MELLVVIAVIGVLAGIVLLAVNPGEQLSRGRDTSRVSAVTQLGRTLQAFYTANSNFPTEGTDWVTQLITAGDVKAAPTNPDYAGAAPAAPICTYASYAEGGTIDGYCYQTDDTDAVVYVKLESTLNESKCAGTEDAFYVFSTAEGRSGVVCRTAAAGEPIPGSQTFVD